VLKEAICADKSGFEEGERGVAMPVNERGVSEYPVYVDAGGEDR
jgi:hypothetical protein